MKVCKLPICYIFQLPNKIYSKTSNLHKTEVKCIKYPLPYATSIFILHFFFVFFQYEKKYSLQRTSNVLHGFILCCQWNVCQEETNRVSETMQKRTSSKMLFNHIQRAIVC